MRCYNTGLSGGISAGLEPATREARPSGDARRERETCRGSAFTSIFIERLCGRRRALERRSA
jgi:hypothetical protein